MKTVAFRVDGGKSVGMGHIMRCLSLAKELRKKGYKVYFISKFKEGIDKIKEYKFETIILDYNQSNDTTEFNYGNVEDLKIEFREIINILKQYKFDFFIVDTYNVSEKFFINIKKYIGKLVYIDDVNKFIYPVDILINGNITAEYMDYVKYSDDEIMLLGPKYNMIRDEFINLPDRIIRNKVEEIMLTTGGADPFNMSIKLLNCIIDSKEITASRINVVIGSGFTNREELIKIKQRNTNVILYENVKSMSQIMLKSDIAISSGGSTLYELCACGTPVLTFIYADNQEFLVNKMEELEYVNNLGWFDELKNEDVQKTITNLMNNYDKRIDISLKQKQLLDGKGIYRIVSVFDNI